MRLHARRPTLTLAPLATKMTTRHVKMQVSAMNRELANRWVAYILLLRLRLLLLLLLFFLLFLLFLLLSTNAWKLILVIHVTCLMMGGQEFAASNSTKTH